MRGGATAGPGPAPRVDSVARAGAPAMQGRPASPGFGEILEVQRLLARFYEQAVRPSAGEKP